MSPALTTCVRRGLPRPPIGGEDPDSSPPSLSPVPPGRPPARTLHRDFSVSLAPHAVDLATSDTDPLNPPSATRLPSQHYCGQGAIIGCSPDRSHVVLIPVRCHSWDCPRCGPRKRAAYIKVLASGKPQRELTLTAPAEPNTDPREIAIRMKKAWSVLVKRIRTAYGLFEYALVWELTKKGTPHAHILFRGSYISKRWLSQQWVSLGFGPVVFIQSVKDSGLHSAHACKYLSKATGQTAVQLAPLRLVQKSSGYVLVQDPKPTADRFPGFRWATSQSPFPFNVDCFQKSPRYIDSIHHPDGTIEIFLEPSPLPPWADPKDIAWTCSPDHCAHLVDSGQLSVSSPPPLRQRPLELDRAEQARHARASRAGDDTAGFNRCLHSP